MRARVRAARRVQRSTGTGQRVPLRMRGQLRRVPRGLHVHRRASGFHLNSRGQGRETSTRTSKPGSRTYETVETNGLGCHGRSTHERATMKEQWRPIPWLTDHEVSNRGRVRSWRGRGKLKTRPTIRKPQPHNQGHFAIALRRVGDRRVLLVPIHRLVLEAFVGPASDGMVCRHLNGNGEDNRLSNLRWGTHRENAQDAIRLGETTAGERHWNAKLTRHQVNAIRRSKKRGIDLAIRYGVSQQTICMVRRGHSWKSKP